MKVPRQSPVAEGDGSPPLGDYRDRFRQIAGMAEILDHLHDFAGDIRQWRSPIEGQPSHGGADEIWRAYGDLGPVTQRAFEALVAGIDRLAQSAADLCDHKHEPPTADEIRAGAEIGQSMRQLLDRAMALVDSAGVRR